MREDTLVLLVRYSPKSADGVRDHGQCGSTTWTGERKHQLSCMSLRFELCVYEYSDTKYQSSQATLPHSDSGVTTSPPTNITLFDISV